MYGLLVAVTVLLSVTLIVLVVSIVIYVKRLDRAVGEIEKTLSAVRKEIVPLAADMRHTLGNIDDFLVNARRQCDQMQRVTRVAEDLLEGKSITQAAGAVVSKSRTTMLSALEGLKETLKALRASKTQTNDMKEEPHNEQ